VKVLFWTALASGPLALGLWWLAGLNPAVTEAVYSRGLYPAVMAPWSRCVGLVPVGLAPFAAAALVVVAVGWLFAWGPLKGLAAVAALASVLVAWFVVGWGLNYQRLSWADNHDLKTTGGSVAQLEALATALADHAGPLRAQAYASGTPRWSGDEVRRAVTRAYARHGVQDPLLAGDFGNPKAFPFPDALSWLGIAGIFIPFTGEPLVNTGPTNWQLPFTSAHEAAHLRGWAREDEANFLAFWVLHDDADPAMAYSAWGSALLYVASALGSAGPRGNEAWGRVKAHVDPAVLADWRASFAYWEKFQGPVQHAAQAVNDAYLKSQGQADGVKSYGRVVDLLLALNLR
jgi:hypothetical protein